jgi:Uma2 family endonuclease
MPVTQDRTLPRRVTYEDYCGFPNDGMRYEILDGEVHVTPAPVPRHQFASKQLQRLLETYFEGPRDCVVFDAPLDVILANADVVQPDLVVVAKGPQISERGIEGAPLVLVEILSPSQPGYDRVTKARRYAFHGVPHYWIVDPLERSVECFRLVDGIYRLDATGRQREDLTVPAFDGLTLPLAGLWLE